jgi:hypothetical protein
MSTDPNTDGEVSAFSAALQAAVNQLFPRVNTFDGAIPPNVLAPADELIE